MDSPDEPQDGDKMPDPLKAGGLSPAMELSEGDADFELIRLIGQGAYGEVWLVRDKAGNYSACKVIYRASFQEERPYEREYQGIRNFEPVSQANPNQIKIHHVGRRDTMGCFYYIMELADDASTGREIHP